MSLPDEFNLEKNLEHSIAIKFLRVILALT